MSRIMFGVDHMQVMILLCVSLGSLAILVNTNGCQAAVNDDTWAEMEKHISSRMKRDQYWPTSWEIATNWLKELRQSPSSANEDIVEALESLEKLGKIAQEYRCDQEARELRESIHAQTSWWNFRFVGSIALNLVADNARHCFVYHHEKYRKLQREHPDSVEMKRSQSFFYELFFLINTNSLSAGSFPFQRDEDYLDWLVRISPEREIYSLFIYEFDRLPSCFWDQVGDVAFNTIESIASREEDSELVKRNIRKIGDGESTRIEFDSHGAQELFSRLIMDSCRLFVEKYGPAVFEYAEGDVRYVDSEDIISSYDSTTGKDFFYLHWAQYKICSHLFWRDRDLRRVLSLIGEKAEEHARNPFRSAQTDDSQTSSISRLGSSAMQMFNEGDVPVQTQTQNEQIGQTSRRKSGRCHGCSIMR